MLSHASLTLLLITLTARLLAADPQCPDGVVAFAECDSTDDCARFDLACLKLEDGQAFCCGVDEVKAANATVSGQKSRKEEKAPEREETCFDNLGECGRKSRICQRNAYKRLMVKYCPRTCGFCQEALSRRVQFHAAPVARANCSDAHSACESRQFMCQVPQYYSLMKKNCRSTCGMC